MLSGLYIQDIVLIDSLSLEIGGGLTALTGETGAGKSIMLDALGLATGGRADKGLVRKGAKQGVVTAIFEPPADSAIWHRLGENGLSCDPGEPVILRRVQESDGRSRGFINDHPVSVSLLRTAGEDLIEVHGQHQGQGFLQTAAHRGLLDDFGAHGAVLAATGSAHEALKQAEDALAARRQEMEEALQEADYLRHMADELSALAPQEGEEAVLAEKRLALMAAEKVAAELSDAAEILADESLEQRMSGVIGRLERAAGGLPEDMSARLSALSVRVDTALAELQEAKGDLGRLAGEFLFDEQELNETEERLFSLRAAARKFNRQVDQLPGLLVRTEEALGQVEEGEAGLSKLEEQLEKAVAAYDLAAERLSAARQKAARALEKAMAKELAPLKLDKAQFFVRVAPVEGKRSVHGRDQVEFLVATNPGADPGPLKQIASGGELSRFVLALKAALMAQENRTVIIFDEVDSGIGGAVAAAVGERLARLAANAQVLVVTHSPQVAARGDSHFRVEKTGSRKVTTRIERLDEAARVEEIARMLSGAEITAEARAAAEKLLARAPARKRPAA